MLGCAMCAFGPPTQSTCWSLLSCKIYESQHQCKETQSTDVKFTTSSFLDAHKKDTLSIMLACQHRYPNPNLPYGKETKVNLYIIYDQIIVITKTYMAN